MHNRVSLNIKFFRPSAILWIILMLVSFQGIFAQYANSKKYPELDIRFGLATYYDDNILRYSDKYLDRFMNNEDPGRFHIDTYDDIVLNPSIELTGTYRLFGKMKSELSLEYSPRFYCVNGIKNWNYLAIGYRQYFTRKASFRLIYAYIPDYYIRHFQDDDWYAIYGDVPEQYQPMGFAKNNYGIWVQNTFFRNTTIRASFYYAQYYYNKHFTEYDCKDLSVGGRIFQPIGEDLKLELAYEFTTSDAKGYDEPGETKENSDESDASYYENGFEGKIIWDMPHFFDLHHNLSLQGGFQKRIYTSEHYLELDPLHVGREDNISQFSVQYDVRLVKSLNLKVYYNWFMRNTDTRAEQNKEYVSAEKDYRQDQFGFELIYNLNFK
jgi:hypothetical protein